MKLTCCYQTNGGYPDEAGKVKGLMLKPETTWSDSIVFMNRLPFIFFNHNNNNNNNMCHLASVTEVPTADVTNIKS